MSPNNNRSIRLAVCWFCLCLCLQSLTKSATAAAAAAPPVDEKCLTLKMLISCSTRSPGVIACGGGGRGVSAPVNQPSLATEILLEWDHNASTPYAAAPVSQASLSLELSKPSPDLGLVLLDLSGTRLCTRWSSGVQLSVSFPASPGPRLALTGLKLGTASRLVLQGNVVVNAALLGGLPAMEMFGVLVGNNFSLGSEPLGRYAVSGAPALTTAHLVGCIHSVNYGTPLFSSLASLHTVRIGRNNMLLLKAGSFVGLPSLRYLYLSENNLQDLEAGSLAGLSSLEQLHLDANGLKRLGNYAFGELASLKRLTLSKNRLSQIEPNAFHGLAKLEHLDLSENQLTILPEAVFAQLHSLRTLILQQNPDLQHGPSNDTFCPLEALTTLWTDAPVDCERFGAARVVQIVSPRRGGTPRRKKYDCDIRELPAEQRPCRNWLERLALRQEPAETALAERPSVKATNGDQQQRQPSRLNIILLVIFAIVCLVHVLTTAVTIYVCRHMRRSRRRNGAGPAANQRKSPSSLSSPEEERSLDASPGLGGPKDPVLVSFQQSSAQQLPGNGAKKSGEKDGPSSRLNVRDKSYDFNEDESRS